jgi:hypothetical protein
MTFLGIVGIVCLVVAIWVRFSKEEGSLTQLKTDILLARKIAERADVKTLDLTEMVIGMKKKVEMAYDKAMTADYVAHSAKMDAQRIQQHNLTVRIKPARIKPKAGRMDLKSTEDKLVKKVKEQVKELSK